MSRDPRRHRVALIAAAIGLAAIAHMANGDGSSPNHVGEVTVQQIFANGRPADLFELVYGSDDDRCEAILKELNKPFVRNGQALDYFDILSHSGSEASWKLLPKSTGFFEGFAELAQADLFNTGSQVFVFRLHGMSANRDYTALVADGPAQQASTVKAPVASAAWDTLASGKLDDALLVPRAKDYDSFSGILHGLGLTKVSTGYARHNLFSLQGRTYVIEGNTYEFARPDFYFVYSGHPDGSFSLDCVLDPRVFIPNNPPDLYEE